MAYPLELKVQARTLYVEGGLTYDEVADETGVSLSQLKEWGKEGNWFVERMQHERDFLSMHSNVMRAKVKLAEKAVNTQDPQAIYALSRLLEVGKRNAKEQGAISRSLLAELLTFTASKYLDSFEQIGGLLLAFIEEANPDVLRLKSWQRKELKDKIQASIGKVGMLATKKSLDQETLKKIREEVYGIVDTGA